MERDLMKQEQDAAYYESLAADRAKAQAEQIKQDEEIEKSRQAQMDQDLKEVRFSNCPDKLFCNFIDSLRIVSLVLKIP